jgi:hypothetical protein
VGYDTSPHRRETAQVCAVRCSFDQKVNVVRHHTVRSNCEALFARCLSKHQQRFKDRRFIDKRCVSTSHAERHEVAVGAAIAEADNPVEA